MYNSIEKTKKSVLDEMCQEIDKICSLLIISIDEFITMVKKVPQIFIMFLRWR